MGMVNARARKIAASRTGTRKTAVCCVCGKVTNSAVFIRSKGYTDGDGVWQPPTLVPYDRECRKMQAKGLLNAGADRPAQDSTGKPCGGCNSEIDADDAHAHRNGVPYHKECLF